jgi:SAM-dependent methyltransferase
MHSVAQVARTFASRLKRNGIRIVDRVGRNPLASGARRRGRAIGERVGFHRGPPLPPKRLRFMNESDERFITTGDDLLADLRAHAHLTERARVLDLGCGYGRFAHALLRWPEFRGTYVGIDILPAHVAWCRDNLQRDAAPEIRFSVLDVQNARYNPNGRLRPEELRLDIADQTIDATLLASVFTHMYEEHVLPYLDEVRRVLAPSGHAMVSFFLLNESWRAGEAAGTSAYPMAHVRNDHCRYMNAQDPLHAIAYDEEWLLARIRERGLELAVPPLYGSWSGRGGTPRFQDFLVLRPA